MDASTMLVPDAPAPRVRRRALGLCALVSLLDGYDVLVVAVTIPAMARDWSIPPAAFGIVLAATSLAMALGASLMGSMGDRFGRRPLIIGSFALAGITTLAVPLVSTIAHLVVLRFLTGLGLGASLANALALGSEFARPEARSRVVTAIYAVSGIGGIVGGIITPWLIGAGGWQAVYLFGGGFPLAICLILLVMLPESPSFAGPHHQIIDRTPDRATTLGPLRLIAGLFGRSFTFATLLIWLLFFVSSFSAYLISGWLPTLMHASGWTLADSTHAITAFSLGGVISGLTLGWLADRGRGRSALVLAYLATSIALVALSAAPPVLFLWFTLILILGAATTGVMYVLPGIAARSYPASLGATGIGAASAIGRVGSTLAPLAGSALLLAGFNGVSLLVILVVPMSLGLIASLLFPLIVRAGRVATEGRV